MYVFWYTVAEQGAGVHYASSLDGGNTFELAVALLRNVPVAQVGAVSARRVDGVVLTWEDPLSDSVYVGLAADSDLAFVGKAQSKAPDVASLDASDVLVWHDGSQARLRVTRMHHMAGSMHREEAR